MVIALPTPQGKPNLANAEKPRQLRLSAILAAAPRAAVYGPFIATFKPAFKHPRP
jgi:hypothetical protein